MATSTQAPANHAVPQLVRNRRVAPVVERILYCHGFASCFDPEKDKIRALSTLAPVDGVTIDYTFMPKDVFTAFAKAMTAPQNTLIIGTSMGGFFAAWLGSELGLPFVAINPAIAPAISLRKHFGTGRTHFGASFVLKPKVVNAYADLHFRLDGNGTIALDLGDEVIDAHATMATIDNRVPLITFSGGSHRFDHMTALLPLIQNSFFSAVKT